jgi:hypothetical protein
MGLNYSPKLDTDGLIFTYQPGQTTIFNNFTASNASDVSLPSQGYFTGPRRKAQNAPTVFDDQNNINAKQPVLEIANIGNSIYDLDVSQTSTYTISLWVRLVQFPSKYQNTKGFERSSELPTKSKRAALARFDFKDNPATNHQNGYIEFGAMAPYYLDGAGEYTYKSVFSPISFGAAICTRTYIQTVYTDYKFNLNEWYLITLQLESNTTFNNNQQTLNVKMFVNNSQENIASCLGIAWRQSSFFGQQRGSFRKRYEGKVAAQPGFANSIGADTGFAVNAASQTLIYNNFFNLSKLNYASFSPIKTFGVVYENPNNGVNLPINSSPGASSYKMSSSVNFGQLYIYNKPFNNSIYQNFRSLYT